MQAAKPPTPSSGRHALDTGKRAAASRRDRRTLEGCSGRGRLGGGRPAAIAPKKRRTGRQRSNRGACRLGPRDHVKTPCGAGCATTRGIPRFGILERETRSGGRYRRSRGRTNSSKTPSPGRTSAQSPTSNTARAAVGYASMVAPPPARAAASSWMPGLCAMTMALP